MAASMTGIQRTLGRLAMAMLIAAGLAACTSASTANQASTPPSPVRRSPSATPSPVPQPTLVTGTAVGKSTPQEVVAGFLNATNVESVALGSGFPTSCGYVVPSDQAACPSFLGQATLTGTPPVSIGNIATNGTQAIVAIVGSLCADFTCSLNTNPNQGLPASPAGFAAAYQAALQGIGNGYAALPCVLVGGSWYVNLG